MVLLTYRMAIQLAGLLPLVSSFRQQCGAGSVRFATQSASLKPTMTTLKTQNSSLPSMNRNDNDFGASSLWENSCKHLAAIMLSSMVLCVHDAQAAVDASAFFGVNTQEGTISSPFAVPGATPRVDRLPTTGILGGSQEIRDARNRAYDEAFQKDARDRDEYYGKMALQKKQQALAEQQELRKTMGLDDNAGRVGDKIETMNSLTQYLLSKDPATMTPAEFNEFKVLQRKAELKESNKAIQEDQSQEAAQIAAIAQTKADTTKEISQAVNERQALEKEEFQQKIQAKKEKLMEIKDRQEQDIFDSRMDAIDAFMTRKESMQR